MNTLTIIGANIATLAIFSFIINKRIDDIKELFKAELKAELSPINQKLNNHITDTDRKIDDLSKQVKEVNEKLDRLLTQK